MAVETAKFESVELLKTDLKDLILSVCAIQNVRSQDINDDDYLINGQGALQLESIDAVDLAVAIERKYGVRIQDISSAREHMKSVNTLANHIFSKQQVLQ